MKLYKLMLMLALATAVVTAGCGGSDEEQKPGGPGAPGVPGITAPINGTIPTGCYSNGYTNCAPCPTGYLQTGNSCVLNSVGNTQCPVNTTWNGYSCMPSGYGNCPSGLTLDPNNAGCNGQGYSVPNNYQNYTCYPIGQQGGLWYYSCQYVQYAPSQGYYYNGYGWARW